MMDFSTVLITRMALKIDLQNHQTLPAYLLDYVLNLKHFVLKYSWEEPVMSLS